MNCTKVEPQKPDFAMRGRQTLLAVTGALALLCTTPALAAPITFETITPSGYEAGATVTEGGYNILMLDGPFGGANGTVMDNDSCAVLACPSGASGQFLSILNDGGVNFALSTPHAPGFRVAGFDFAFLAPVGGLPDANYGRLTLTGLLVDGSMLMTSLAFPGQDTGGSFMFGAASLGGSFASAAFTSLTFSACIFDDSLDCVNSLDNPAYYQAQFALDNLQLNAILDPAAVPEPVSILLMGMGMGAMALTRRRPAFPINRQAQGI